MLTRLSMVGDCHEIAPDRSLQMIGVSTTRLHFLSCGTLRRSWYFFLECHSVATKLLHSYLIHLACSFFFYYYFAQVESA